MEDVPYRDNPKFNPDEYFDNIIGVTRFGNPTEIIFRATKEQAGYIETKPIHKSQKIIEKNKEDGTITFSVFVEPNWEFISLMLGFGAGVRILSPEYVVEEIKRKLKKAIDAY